MTTRKVLVGTGDLQQCNPQEKAAEMCHLLEKFVAQVRDDIKNGKMVAFDGHIPQVGCNVIVSFDD